MATTVLPNTGVSTMDKGDTGWHTVWNANAVLIDAFFVDATQPNKAVVYYNSSGQFAHDESAFLWDETQNQLIIGSTAVLSNALKLSVKHGAGGNSTGQPDPGNGWVAVFYTADGASGGSGVFIKSNDSNATTRYLEIGQDIVAGAYDSYFTIFATGSVRILKSGLLVGNPTGGNKGQGTINVATEIYKNDTSYANPAYVIENWLMGKIERFKDKEGASEYQGMLALGEVEKYMRENFHLPGIDEEKPLGIFGRGDKALEKLEELTIYLIQHEHRLAAIEAKLA